MTSPAIRKFAWFTIAEAIVLLVIFILGLVLARVNIRPEGHDLLLTFLGPHGIVFNLVLPLLAYVLVLALFVWMIIGIRAECKSGERGTNSRAGD